MTSVAVGVQLVDINLAAESIAVYAKDLGSARLVAIGAVQDAFDETLFEFANGFVKKNSPLDHLSDKPFQLVFHNGTLRSKIKV